VKGFHIIKKSFQTSLGAILDPDKTEPRTTSYPLEVIAFDGGIGEAQHKARTLVNITVIDVNNKPPVFVEPGTVR